MNCPHCGVHISGLAILHECENCKRPIYYGLDGYAKTLKEALARAESVKAHNAKLELAEQEQKQYFSSTEYKNQIVNKANNGRMQAALYSIGSAFVYAIFFTAITAPLLYFFVQPIFLHSYSVTSLLMGAYIFYFIFGFTVMYITNRSIGDAF